jgi:hypothetical protein
VLDGLLRQLYNCPIDMLIESRLLVQLPELRRVQLLSLQETNRQAFAAVSSGDVERLTPRAIYEASAALNAAYALFTDDLTHGRTTFGESYSDKATRMGAKLFAMFQQALGTYEPGAEYRLVDRFARVLRLDTWYEWIPDESAAPIAPAAEPSDDLSQADLLRERSAASTMYLWDALKRFSSLTNSQVFTIASEAAMVGRNGLGFTSSEKRYTLAAFPGERFSGLQMMCFMYAGFQRINPSLDLGFDLSAEYQAALQLFGTDQVQQ